MYTVHIHRICGGVSTTNVKYYKNFTDALECQATMATLLETMAFSRDTTIDGATESVQIMIRPDEDGDIYCAAIYTR